MIILLIYPLFKIKCHHLILYFTVGRVASVPSSVSPDTSSCKNFLNLGISYFEIETTRSSIYLSSLWVKIKRNVPFIIRRRIWIINAGFSWGYNGKIDIISGVFFEIVSELGNSHWSFDINFLPVIPTWRHSFNGSKQNRIIIFIFLLNWRGRFCENPEWKCQVNKSVFKGLNWFILDIF